MICELIPEVVHSVEGGQMLVNFAKYICACEKNWNMGNFAKEQIKKIKDKVGDKKVLFNRARCSKVWNSLIIKYVKKIFQDLSLLF